MSKHTRKLFWPSEVGIISKFSTNILYQSYDLLCIRIHIHNSFRIKNIFPAKGKGYGLVNLSVRLLSMSMDIVGETKHI